MMPIGLLIDRKGLIDVDSLMPDTPSLSFTPTVVFHESHESMVVNTNYRWTTLKLT